VAALRRNRGRPGKVMILPLLPTKGDAALPSLQGLSLGAARGDEGTDFAKLLKDGTALRLPSQALGSFSPPSRDGAEGAGAEGAGAEGAGRGLLAELLAAAGPAAEVQAETPAAVGQAGPAAVVGAGAPQAAPVPPTTPEDAASPEAPREALPAVPPEALSAVPPAVPPEVLPESTPEGTPEAPLDGTVEIAGETAPEIPVEGAPEAPAEDASKAEGESPPPADPTPATAAAAPQPLAAPGGTEAAAAIAQQQAGAGAGADSERPVQMSSASPPPQAPKPEETLRGSGQPATAPEARDGRPRNAAQPEAAPQRPGELRTGDATPPATEGKGREAGLREGAQQQPGRPGEPPQALQADPRQQQPAKPPARGLAEAPPPPPAAPTAAPAAAATTSPRLAEGLRAMQAIGAATEGGSAGLGSGGEPTGGTSGELLTQRPAGTAATAEARAAQQSGQPLPPALPEQIGLRIQRAVVDGRQRMTLQLHPAELGRVDIRLEFASDGTLRAQITADRPEALDLLQRDARGLERALTDAGLKTDGQSLNFDLREQGQQRERAEQRQQGEEAGQGERRADAEGGAQPHDENGGPGNHRGLVNLSV